MEPSVEDTELTTLIIEGNQRREARFTEKVEGWEAAGHFTPHRIQERLTVHVKDKLSEQEKQYFEFAFHTYSVKPSRERWDEASFTTFIARLFPPPFPPLQEATPILFRYVQYCASIPFSTVPELSSHAFLRGVSIPNLSKNPMSHGSQLGKWLISRRWRREDEYRLLFCGLASRVSASQPVPAAGAVVLSLDPRQDASDNNDYEDLDDYVDVSHEGPGTTNLLDVLTITQPDQAVKVPPVPRAWFRRVAESLPHSEHTVEQLLVSKEDWRRVIKLLLVMRIDLGPGPNTECFVEQMAEVDSVVCSVFNAFDQPEDESIGWQTWEKVIKISCPLLSSSLGNLFNCFIYEKNKYPIYSRSILPNPGSLMTLTRLSQIACFLPEFTPLKTLQPVYSKSSVSGGSMQDLLKAVKTHKGLSILLISGSPVSGTFSDSTASFTTVPNAPSLFLFGAYVSTPWTMERGTNCGDEESLLFQLSPIHEVFHANNGREGYVHIAQDGAVIFGDNQGASLTIDLTLQEVVFAHSAEIAGSFQGSTGVRSGKDWGETFRVDEVEVWMMAMQA